MVTRLNYDQRSSIIISVAFFSASKNSRLSAEFWFSTHEFLNSLTFPDNWWIFYIPWLFSDLKTFSDFPWLFQFSLTWTNPAFPLHIQQHDQKKNPTRIWKYSIVHVTKSTLSLLKPVCSCLNSHAETLHKHAFMNMQEKPQWNKQNPTRLWVNLRILNRHGGLVVKASAS